MFVMVFAATFLIFLTFYKDTEQQRQEVEQRLYRAVSQAYGKRKLVSADQDGIKGKNTIQGLLRRTSGIFAKRKISKKMDIQLTKADIPLKGEEFTVIVFALAVLAFLLVLILSGSLKTSIMFGLIGAALPFLYVKRAKDERLLKLDDQITDAITILTNSLRSGYSFLQSLDMVRKELPPPLKTELARTIREINLGVQVEEALSNLAGRSGSRDMDMIVTAVLIQRQVGGNLAEILDKINETINERLKIKGEVRTLTAQGRISGLIIGLLPLALALILFTVNADYMMTLFENTLGLCMVGAAIILELVGFVMIRRIINIEI